MTLTNQQPTPTSSSERPRRSARIQLSATQVVASALAAVTATIAASYLGVNGTVIGAALASVVTVVGNAVYGHSIHRTRDRVRTVVLTSAGAGPAAYAAPEGEADATAAAEEHVSRGVVLRRLGIGCLAVFAVLNVVITGVELVAGKPVSDLLRGRGGNGTTLFGAAQARTSSPAPSHTQPGQPTVTVTASVVVQTPTVTRTAPPVTATVTPTPTVTVSATPSTPVPTNTTTPAPTPSGTGTPAP